jgi:transposase
MKATSEDLRKRVVAARYEDGQSMGAIAERFRIPKPTVQSILRRFDQSGTLQPKPHGGGRRPAFSPEATSRLEKAVQARPDSTLEELRDACGVTVSLVAYHNKLKRLGFTRKKSLYVRQNSGART